MYLDKNGDNTLFEYGWVSSYVASSKRIVLTQTGDLYLIKNDKARYKKYPVGNLEDIDSDHKIFLENIDVTNIFQYITDLAKDWFMLPQFIGDDNGCDGTYDSIEILDYFRIKGHMLFGELDIVRTNLIKNPTFYEKFKEESLKDQKVNGLVSIDIIVLNIFKIIFNNCKNTENKLKIKAMIDKTRHYGFEFDFKKFFDEKDTLLKDKYNYQNYKVEGLKSNVDTKN